MPPPIAIELIEEAAIAVGHMMSTLFFPVVPFLMEVVFVIWFIVVAAFLGTYSTHITKFSVTITFTVIETEFGNSAYF